MESYFDVAPIPSAGFTSDVVLEHVMQELHALFIQRDGDTAIDFPLLKGRQVGGVLRVFSFEAVLNEYADRLCLNRSIQRNAVISRIAKIPDTVAGYACLSRNRSIDKYTPSAYRRFRERKIELNQWSDEADSDWKQKAAGARKKSLPKIKYRSASTGQKVTIFLQRTKLASRNIGKFNGFGLAETCQGATIPIF